MAYRIDLSSAAAVKPSRGAAGPKPGGFFQDTDAAGGTIVPADFANMIQDEICNVVEGAGITLDKEAGGAASDNQLLEAIRSMAMNYYSGAPVASGAPPATYTPIDLSSIVGANRCWVHISIKQLTGTATYYSARTNGQTEPVSESSAGPGGTNSVDVSLGAIGELSLTTDSAGVIEWIGTIGTGTAEVKLLAYQILQ